MNIVEDESVPIRILKVSPNEIHLVNGDVVPSTCVFLHGHPFIWTPPTVDPMTAMPNGKGWEDWTDDVWTIFDITSPKPGSYTLYDVLISRNFNFWHREYRFTSSLQNQGTTSLNGHPTWRTKYGTWLWLTFSGKLARPSTCLLKKEEMSLQPFYRLNRHVVCMVSRTIQPWHENSRPNNARNSLR